MTILLAFLCLPTIAQYTFDGSYAPCPPDAADEYANAFAPDPQPNSGSSTCDITSIYLDIYEDGGSDFFIVGLEHGNSGQSNFRVYFNTDCDPTTGQQLAGENVGDANPTVDVGGAEFYVNFTTNNNPSVDLFEWDGTQFVSSTTGGDALTGDSCDAAGDFVEVRIPLTDLFDPCADDGCGIIEITTTISNAGGSANSNFCEQLGLSIPLPVNDPPTPDFTFEVQCPINQTPTQNGFLPCVDLSVFGPLDPNYDLGDIVSYQWNYYINGSATPGTLGTFSNPSGMGITDANEADANTNFCPDASEVPAEYTFELVITDTFDCLERTEEMVEATTYTVNIDFLTEAECLLLPVELHTFTGEFLNQKTVELTWETASELENEWFVVEKRYFEGAEFEPIQQLAGAGTTDLPTTYKFIDQGVDFDEVQYRLKQIDYSGEFAYSEIISLKKIIDNNDATVFSNGDEFIVTIETSDENYPQTIEVYNMFGQVIEVIDLPQDQQKFQQVYLGDLTYARSMFFINIVYNNGQSKVLKAMK